MKTKNLVLAAAAFCTAVGAAIASSFAPTAVWVHARATQFSPITCIDTSEQCDAPGGSTCQVQVNTTNPTTGGTQIATTTGSFKTYDTNCVNVLNSTSSALNISGLTVYQLEP